MISLGATFRGSPQKIPDVRKILQFLLSESSKLQPFLPEAPGAVPYLVWHMWTLNGPSDTGKTPNVGIRSPG